MNISEDVIPQEELEIKILSFVLEDENNLRQAVNKALNYKHFCFIPEESRFPFYSGIYKIIVEFYYKFNSSITQEAFQNELNKRQLDQERLIGLNTSFAKVMSQNTKNSNFEYLIEELKMRSLKRKSFEFPSKMKDWFTNLDAYEATKKSKDFWYEIESSHFVEGIPTKILDVGADKDSAIEFWEAEEKRIKRLGTIKFGIPELDEASGGIKSGQLVVFLGEAGKGKSTVLLNCASNAHKENKNVLFFSFEMPLWQCMARYYSLNTGVPYANFKNFSLNENQDKIWKRFLDRQEKESDSYFYFIDQPDNCSSEEIEFHIKNLISSGNKPDVIFVDYLGNMVQESGVQDGKDYEKIAKATRELRRMARVYEIPMVTAQQINREGLKASRKKQESNDIENFKWYGEMIADSKKTMDYADIVVGLSPQEVSEPSPHLLMWLHCIKARDFFFENFFLAYDPEICKIVPIEKNQKAVTAFGGKRDTSEMASVYNEMTTKIEKELEEVVLPVDVGVEDDLQ